MVKVMQYVWVIILVFAGYTLAHGQNIELATSYNQNISNSSTGSSFTTALTIMQTQVEGTVTDSESGEPIPGVNVVIAGSAEATGSIIGAQTDIDGRYSIVVPEGLNTLIFTYVGYQRHEVQIEGRTTIDVQLAIDITELDEAVVVAFGIQTPETVTGSISSISAVEIKQSPAANMAVALTGRLPGLITIQTTGEPGLDDPLLFLRGRSTLNEESPMILVDGIERDLGYVNPNEVESVTILKDASATALFGVRGANGVVLVETRRGHIGTPSISYSYEYGLQDFTRRPSVVDSYDWALLKNQAWYNDNPGIEPGDPVNRPPFSDYALERFRLGDFPEAYPNNNWQEMMMHDFVDQQRHNLSLSGGSDYIQYFVNVGYLDQGGQWKVVEDHGYDPASWMRRANFRSNIDAKLNSSGTLRTFLNAGGYLERVNRPNASTADILRFINNQMPPILPGPLTPDGHILTGLGFDGIYNNSPYELINRSGYQQETRSNIAASWGMEYDLSNLVTQGLSVKFMGSFDTRSIHNLTGSKTFPRYRMDIIQGDDGEDDIIQYVTSDPTRQETPLNTSISTLFDSFTNYQLFVNYNRQFRGVHRVTGLFMAQQESRVLSGERLPFNLQGFASRLTYGYDDRYNFEFNMGYNGSEQFAEGRQYGFFPSGSVGWVISNESFMDNLEAISLLKLRGSYGAVGGDRLGSRRFLYIDEIVRVGGGGYSSSLDQGGYIDEAFIGNPFVSWEVAHKANVGLEIGLYDQLELTVDVFDERRDNVLIHLGTIPQLYGISGSSLAPQNLGVVHNQGYEIELNYRKIFSPDLSVISKLNFNHNRNEVINSDELPLPEDYAYQYRSEGYPIGQFFGYIRDGFYESQEEIDNSGLTYGIGSPRVGDFRFVDVNEDGVIDARDVVPIGYSTVPEYTFGAAFNINYKHFDFSVLLQGVYNVSKYFGDLGNREQQDFRERHKRAWTPERAASGESIEYPALSLGLAYSHANFSDFWLEDGSYLRLKSAEIGYTVPLNFTQRIGIQSVRLYANGFNLFTWDRIRTKDFDPEISSGTTYPVYKVFNFGFQIDF